MQGLFNDFWANQDVIREPCCGHHIACRLLVWSSYCSLSRALQIALFVFKVAGITFILFSLLETTDPFLGLGKSVSWKEDRTIIPPGHTMSCENALHISINDFILKAVFSWLGVGPDTPAVEGQAWV